MGSSRSGDVIPFSVLFSLAHHFTPARKLREFLKGVMQGLVIFINYFMTTITKMLQKLHIKELNLEWEVR